MFTTQNIPLTEKQLKDFQRIYKQDYGKSISREQALEEAVALLNFVGVIVYKDFLG